jgi:rod shape-determining protein MreC
MAWAIDARRRGLLLAGLVLGHLVVISGQVDGGGGASVLERVVFTLLSPFQTVVGSAVRGVRGAWSGYLDLRRVAVENERLTERLAVLERQLHEKSHLASEAQRLRQILELREILPLPTVAAEIVAREGLPWFRTITLNKGTRAGITLNAPVISVSGVVGRVVAVGPDAAKVQLLLDRDCAAGVLIERSRVTGVLSGQIGFADSGTTDLVMKYVPALADVVVGDVVVTSGTDQLFPEGLVVGRVRSVSPPGSGLFREVLVLPSARFDQIEEVMVVKVTPARQTFTEAVR